MSKIPFIAKIFQGKTDEELALLSPKERREILEQTREVLEAEVNQIRIEKDKVMQLLGLQKDIDRENKVFFEQEIKKWSTIQTADLAKLEELAK